MKRLALLAAVATTACAAPTAEEIHARFACDDGRTLDVVFVPERELARLAWEGGTLELPQQRTGSGYAYSNGRVGLRGKGRELQLEIGRRVPIDCREVADTPAR